MGQCKLLNIISVNKQTKGCEKLLLQAQQEEIETNSGFVEETPAGVVSTGVSLTMLDCPLQKNYSQSRVTTTWDFICKTKE